MSDDAIADTHALLEAARAWVRAYARIMTPDVPAEFVDSIVGAIGEISVDEAIHAILHEQEKRKSAVSDEHTSDPTPTDSGDPTRG